MSYDTWKTTDDRHMDPDAPENWTRNRTLPGVPQAPDRCARCGVDVARGVDYCAKCDHLMGEDYREEEPCTSD